MRFLASSMLLFISVNSFSQEIKFTGSIIDEHTQEPIAYAHILLLDKKSGTNALIDGTYLFFVKAEDLNSTVKISCVGYYSKVLSLAEMHKTEILELTSKIEDLGAIYLRNPIEKKKRRINSFINKEIIGLGNFSGGSYPSIVARYYERPKAFKKACFLSEIGIDFYATNFHVEYHFAKFRLRILGVAPDGSPGDDLLFENVVVEKDSNALRMTIDMLPYQIMIPEAGFYIAVEHLFIEENKYIEEKTFVINDTLIYENVSQVKYAPIFKGVLEESDSNFKSYYLHPDGWKKMNKLNLPQKILGTLLPAPAFKVTLTD